MGGNREIYGLLGRNIEYSLSPVMHNAAFKLTGIDAEYRLFDIGEDELEAFLDGLVSGCEIKGINVTVPYKIRMKQFLESGDSCSLDPVARDLDSVNTVKIEPESLKGFNTDGLGFYGSLTGETGFDPSGKSVLILGAGGAGRAIGLYLSSCGVPVRKISVFDVDEARTRSLGEVFGRYNGPVELAVLNEDGLHEALMATDLVVNATPLGTKEGDPLPADPDVLKDGTVVYDLVYARETELVARARARGLGAVNGIGMLVNQGAQAFHIWTGEDPAAVRGIMKKAVLEELEGRV